MDSRSTVTLPTIFELWPISPYQGAPLPVLKIKPPAWLLESENVSRILPLSPISNFLALNATARDTEDYTASISASPASSMPLRMTFAKQSCARCTTLLVLMR